MIRDERPPVHALRVFTIGHSTRAIEEFSRLLQAGGITHVADVRTVPRSRRHPHYNREALAATLRAAGVGYTHMAGLGGRRHPRPDSVNTGWQNLAFRGYADYMETPAFAESLDALLALARRERVAVLCTEAVPWRCHRSLIADALAARAVAVEHIVGATRRPHTLTPWARVAGTRVTYPPRAARARE
jgi:uncharacterized protein (DUF488 family)